MFTVAEPNVRLGGQEPDRGGLDWIQAGLSSGLLGLELDNSSEFIIGT